MGNPEIIRIEGLKTIHKLCKFGAEHNLESCSFTEIVERMFEELESVKAQVPEWISVDERLPNGYGQVLAINNKGVIRVAEYAFYEEEWRKAPSLKTAKHPITHWMPLPNSTQDQAHD